jgi:hypothetical protein
LFCFVFFFFFLSSRENTYSAWTFFSWGGSHLSVLVASDYINDIFCTRLPVCLKVLDFIDSAITLAVDLQLSMINPSVPKTFIESSGLQLV